MKIPIGPNGFYDSLDILNSHSIGILNKFEFIELSKCNVFDIELSISIPFTISNFPQIVIDNNIRLASKTIKLHWTNFNKIYDDPMTLSKSNLSIKSIQISESGVVNLQVSNINNNEIRFLSIRC